MYKLCNNVYTILLRHGNNQNKICTVSTKIGASYIGGQESKNENMKLLS